jgi:hypothetical protein
MAAQGSPQWFLNELFAGKPEELYMLIWTLPDKRSRWFREVAPAAAAVEALTGRDVYVGVGLARRDYGPSQRCPADQVAGLTAAWADLDVLSDAHSKKSLPPSIEQALSVLPPEMPPSIVVATGNGAHAWWLLKEPYLFDTERERAWAASVVLRWQTLLRFNAANRGWAFDRLADLARVLRVPGTLNHKDPAHPKPVTVHQVTGRRYNLSDLEDYLDQLGIPKQGTNEQKAAAPAAQAADSSIVINLKAEFPEELIKRWTDVDMRFRNTWFRQRHDLKDQSQSGYDLALADFGMDAGLSAQQIVDLIIQHRRMHGQKQRTRADYFERTLARAAGHSNGNGASAASDHRRRTCAGGPARHPGQPSAGAAATARQPAAGTSAAGNGPHGSKGSDVRVRLGCPRDPYSAHREGHRQGTHVSARSGEREDRACECRQAA